MPLYYQLKELLKAKIESGELRPHERIPSEAELVQLFHVSRMTVRQALVELENEGFIRRKQGQGTFVAEPKLRQGLLRLTSFTEDMEARGLRPGARVLEVRLCQAPELLPQLKAEPGEQFVKIERVRLANGEPMALETSFLRRRFCAGIEELDLTDRSLYATLRERFGLELGWAEQTVEAKLADEYEAEVLGVQAGTPMLLMERTTYLADGSTPIEYVRSSYRGDR
ncbi:MAG: GntR family transcriptional regulator, partial [Candidatus Bipolaricaulia bacterium]